VANVPLLELGVQALYEAGIREVAIVSGAVLGAAAVALAREAALDVRVVHIPEPAGPGLARRLLAAEAFVGDRPFVVELAGTLTSHDLVRSVERLARKRLDAMVVLDRRRARHTIPMPHTGLETRTEDVGLGEEMLAQANAFVFGSEIFDAARSAIVLHGGEPVDIPDAVMALADTRGRVEAVLATGWSERIDDVSDLLEVNRLVLEGLQTRELPDTLSGSRIIGPVAIDKSATIETSALHGPLAIAARACIKDSYVGPYTSIGAEARMDGAEIERSVVLRAACIRNVGARIEGSVIGAGACVTRELAPPRALQLWVGEDSRVSLA
jgi:glucose-1-phosphate thymidylyltransferase